MLLTFSILIFFISLIEGFPTQDAETSTPPKPIIESGVYRQALDSYGNPVAYLEAAKAPDGRKFVQAGEGVQFEIPKYASGITEIKKPHSDLLPPLASDRSYTSPDGEREIKNLQTDIAINQKIEGTSSLERKSQFPLIVQLNLQSISQPNILREKRIESRTETSLTSSDILATPISASSDLKYDEHFPQLKNYFEINPNLIPLSIVPSVELNISPLVAPPTGQNDIKTRIPRIEPNINNPFAINQEESHTQEYINRFEKEAADYESLTVAPEISTEISKNISELNLDPLIPPKYQLNETITFEIHQNDPIQSLILNPLLPPPNNFFAYNVNFSKNAPMIHATKNLETFSKLNLEPLIPLTNQQIDVPMNYDSSGTQIESADIKETNEPLESHPATKSIESNHNKINAEILDKSQTYFAKSTFKPEKMITTTKNPTVRIPTNKFPSESTTQNILRNTNRKPQVISKFSISTLPKNAVHRENPNLNQLSSKMIPLNARNNNKGAYFLTQNSEIPIIKFQNVSFTIPSKSERKSINENIEISTETMEYKSLHVLNLEPFVPPEITHSSNPESTIENINKDKTISFNTSEDQTDTQIETTFQPAAKSEYSKNTDIINQGQEKSSYQDEVESDQMESKNNMKEERKIENSTNSVKKTTASSKYQTRIDLTKQNLEKMLLPTEINDLKINGKIIELPNNAELKLNLQPLVPPIENNQAELDDKNESKNSLPLLSQLNDTYLKLNHSTMEETTINAMIPSEKNQKFTSNNLRPTYTETINSKTTVNAAAEDNINTKSFEPFVENISERSFDEFDATSHIESSSDEYYTTTEKEFLLNIDPLIPPKTNSNSGNKNDARSIPSIKTTKPSKSGGSKYQNSPIINIVLDRSLTNFEKNQRNATLFEKLSTRSNIIEAIETTTMKNLKTEIEKSLTVANSNTQHSTQITTSKPYINQTTKSVKPSSKQHSTFSLSKNITPITMTPEIVSSTIANAKFLSQTVSTDLDQITISTSPTTTTTRTPTTSSNSIINTLTNSISSNFKFFTAAPAPSRLFIPPVFDEKQYSTADGKINSNPSTFSGAPTTSFAERLNFNKNPNQKEVIQGNNLLISTSLTSLNLPKHDPLTPFINGEKKIYSKIPVQDLLPPVETSANQFGISSFAGQEEEIANNESAPSRFANNPFLTKSTGTLEPKQENSAGTFGGAPGVLGNQKPGYAIRPSNNGSSGNIVNTSSTVKSQSPAIKNNFAQKENNIGKYSGGFGGPPGVLAPYDNV